MVTNNLPFDEWTEVFGSERLTGALLDRLTPPCPHPGDERRELPAQSQPGNRRLAGSGRSRGRIKRTVNAASTLPFNGPTPTSLLPSVITPVVHDHAAPVAQYLGAIDNLVVEFHLVFTPVGLFLGQWRTSCSKRRGSQLAPGVVPGK